MEQEAGRGGREVAEEGYITKCTTTGILGSIYHKVCTARIGPEEMQTWAFGRFEQDKQYAYY